MPTMGPTIRTGDDLMDRTIEAVEQVGTIMQATWGSEPTLDVAAYPRSTDDYAACTTDAGARAWLSVRGEAVCAAAEAAGWNLGYGTEVRLQVESERPAWWEHVLGGESRWHPSERQWACSVHLVLTREDDLPV